MLTVLVPLLVALAAPSPVPSSGSEPPSTLKEIGHVEARSICSAIVVHANSAIGTALDNDRDLGLTINHLRTTDLDDANEIQRRNGMNDLSTLTGRIRMAALSGTGEIKRLRDIAAQTVEPTRKAELKAFADALGGAIARQRKAAADLDRALAIIDGRRAVNEINTEELADERAAVSSDRMRSMAGNPDLGMMRSPVAPVAPERFNDVLRSIADDFGERTRAILNDEGVAADHAIGATTGC
jgi:hypothetical protein